jgi:outer membrane protein assembly factor BamB
MSLPKAMANGSSANMRLHRLPCLWIHLRAGSQKWEPTCSAALRRSATQDPGNGRTVWSYPGASAAPAAAHGRIYTASPAGDLIALNASDGTAVWQCPIRFTLGPLVAGNTVYVCDNTTVYAVRAQPHRRKRPPEAVRIVAWRY